MYINLELNSIRFDHYIYTSLYICIETQLLCIRYTLPYRKIVSKIVLYCEWEKLLQIFHFNKREIMLTTHHTSPYMHLQSVYECASTYIGLSRIFSFVVLKRRVYNCILVDIILISFSAVVAFIGKLYKIKNKMPRGCTSVCTYTPT